MNEMISTERPDWQAIMAYVTSIYRHFEVDSRGQWQCSWLFTAVSAYKAWSFQCFLIRCASLVNLQVY